MTPPLRGHSGPLASNAVLFLGKSFRCCAQAEDRSVSSIVRAALKAHLEGGRKAR